MGFLSYILHFYSIKNRNLDFHFNPIPMKKLNIPLVLIAAVLMACNQTEEPKIDYAIFSGKIENANSENVLVYNSNFKHQIEIQEDGTFSDTLYIEDNNHLSFRIGNESSAFYLEKGSNVNLTIDTKMFDESIVYTGAGADENNLLAQRYLLNESLMGEIREMYSMEEAEFLAKIEEVKAENEKTINESTASEAFKKMQLDDATFGFASSMQNYEGYHGYFTGKQEFEVSDDFKAKEVDYATNDENSFRASSNYRSLINNHFSNLVGEKTEDMSYLAALKEVIGGQDNAYIKEELLKGTFAYRLMRPSDELEEGYNFLVENTSNESYTTSYTEKYDKLKVLVKGMPSPQFTDYENHQGGTTSLAELKGKYTYIDVWATWCGPCKREIPHLKEVEEKYHDKNIQFVSTSIDRAQDHDTWVSMVTEEELSGIQLMADKDWKSDFVQDYAIDGIPRFILVDPDGNIVSADAPRPSDPELIALFDELNI